MQLIPFILTIVLSMILLSAVVVFIGGLSQDKIKAVLFLFASVVLSALCVKLTDVAGIIAMIVGGLLLMLFYYLEIRYDVIRMRLIFMKIWTYIILGGIGLLIYLAVFAAISINLFHAEITNDLMLLSFVMAIIVVMIMPILREAYGYINAMMDKDQRNIVYLVRRLNKMATQNVGYDELVKVLARYLHFEYVGLVINGKIFGSHQEKFTKDQIVEFGLLESEPKSVWLKQSGNVRMLFKTKNLMRIAELRNAKGLAFGQLIVGRTKGKNDLSAKDLEELETVVNLVASIVDSKERVK